MKTCFIPLKESKKAAEEEAVLADPFAKPVNPKCKAAAKDLKSYLEETDELEHDFGIKGKETDASRGKMFGVLVVRNKKGKLGYLSAYSGKMNGENNLSRFVPPVGESKRDEESLNKGMRELTEMGVELQNLEKEGPKAARKVASLKRKRKRKSQHLQQRLFEEYRFRNVAGEEKSLLTIFAEKGRNIPPSGAGECAAPKLIQYAYENELTPLALAEFWWGKPRKSQNRKHGEFYTPCSDKCRPILGFMLKENSD